MGSLPSWLPRTAAAASGGAASLLATDKIVFVSSSGSDANDGLSWGAAKATLGAAKTALGSAAGIIALTSSSVELPAPLPALAPNQGIKAAVAGGSVINYTGGAGTAITFDDGAIFEDFTLAGTNLAGTIAFAPVATAARWQFNRVIVKNFDVGPSLDNCWIGAFNDCIFTLCVTTAFRTVGSQVNAIEVRGGEIANSPKGAIIGPGTGVVFDGVAVEGNTTHGLHFTGSTHHGSKVINCYFEANGQFDFRCDSNGRSLVVENNTFLTTPTSVFLAVATNAEVGGNWFNPGGATPKSIVLDSSNVVATTIGENTYVAGAFDPFADDRGVRTRFQGEQIIEVVNPNNYTATVATMVFQAEYDCEVLAVDFVTLSGFSVDAANFWKFSLQRYNSAGTYLGDVAAIGTDTQAMTSQARYAGPTPNATHRKLSKGESIKLRIDKTGTPTAMNGPCMSLRIRPTR